MIYATGDTHGCFQRFAPEHFPEQAEMTRGDYMLICGDFGGVWDGSRRERRALDRLEALPFTTLFVSGNHENFDLLRRYPTRSWHGGLVQPIRPHVLHLLRGQLYDLEGATFFTMGGARSHDIQDGILDPRAADFAEHLHALRSMGGRFRINHRTWWRQELPAPEEYQTARETLARAGHQADYIITHCAPTSIQALLGEGQYRPDPLTDFLEEVRQTTRFGAWLFGHYHENRRLEDRFFLLWEQMVRIR